MNARILHRTAGPIPATRILIPTALLLLASLSGCTASATTHIHLDFDGARADADADLPFGERAAERFYAAHDITHPDFYSAFDQLVQWSDAQGLALKLEPPSEYGFCLDRIGDIPARGGCESGATAFWSLAVNGNTSMVGMDQVELHAGDAVTWTLVALAPAPSNPPPPAAATSLSLTVDPVPPTRNATVTVQGRHTNQARLSVVLIHQGASTPVVAPTDASWSMEVPLPLGNSTLEVTADDGTTTSQVTTSLVRLAHGRMQVDFRGVPGHAARDDEVWFDPDSWPSASYYADQPVPHPDFANVHDLMVAWTAQTGVPVVYKPHASFGSQVMQIDGVGDPTLTSSAAWCYEVNGATASFGITGQEFKDGDVVSWSLGAC